MKTQKIFVAVVALFALPVLFESCYLFESPCDPPPPPASVEDLAFTVTTSPHDYPRPAAPASGKPEVYNFVLDVTGFLARLEQPKHKGHGTMAAYADCAPAPTPWKEKISWIEITSNETLDLGDGVSWKPGTGLTSYFDYRVMEGSDYSSFIMNKEIRDPFVNFVTNFTVPVAQRHQFTFYIRLDDNREFWFETPTIELLP